MYKVVLMGAALDTGNRGVSALASSLIKMVLQVRPDADISFFIGNKSSESQILDAPGGKIRISVINHRFSLKAGLKKHLLGMLIIAFLQKIIPFHAIKKRLITSNPGLETLFNSDFIGDIHGGDSFSDIYGFNKFIIGVIPDIIIVLLGKKLVLLPQTYGPFKSFLSRKIAKYIFKKTTCILSRDKEGAEVVREVLGDMNNGIKVIYCPDVAFVLDIAIPEKIHIEPPLTRETSSLLIGINVNGLLYNGGYTRDNMFGLKNDYKVFIQNLIKHLTKDNTNHVLLVPHTFGPAGNVNSDPDACLDIIKSLEESYKSRVHLLKGEYNQFAIKGIIGLCNFFIGSRMHACIAAISQEIPTVALAYSKKFRGVFESVGLETMVVDARSLDHHEAINRIIGLCRNRELQMVSINKKIDSAREQVKKTFWYLLGNAGLGNEPR